MFSLLYDNAKSANEVLSRVDLSGQAAESTYWVARILMKSAWDIINFFGLSHSHSAFMWVYAFLVFAVSFGIGWILQFILVVSLREIGKHVKNDIYAGLTRIKFFRRMAMIVPVVVFIILIQFTLTNSHSLSSWLTRLSWIYILIILAKAFSGFTEVVWEHFDSRENKKKLPLKGLVQLVKGIIWGIAAIIIGAILLDKSPGALLAGLGAFAAVLMLVFKDSILGLVAGVQLAENDSLHVGDWIVVPGTSANGNVVEVTLTTVKIVNWDKTTTNINPYTLISGSFTNYRTMQLSNTRRIQRSYMIDADSVVMCNENMLDEFSKLPLIAGWIAAKRKQKAEGENANADEYKDLVDGSIETNLGVFRAYMKLYLDSNPNIAKDAESTCFVTTLGQTSTGIPLQVYCFTNTSAWVEFEAIQATIMEHMAAMMTKFNLCTFEYPTGRDTIYEGYLSSGRRAENLFGLPEPFLSNGPANQPSYTGIQTDSANRIKS